MNAEIIGVGSELILGQIDNSNASFLSKELSQAGINVYYHQAVGDNPGRLKNAFTTAKSRADVIILTGGLGPTKDDLTRETVSEITGRKLVYEQAAKDQILSFFKGREQTMTDNNLQQALIPEGAEVFPNDEGLACGSVLDDNGTLVMMLPGPPRELKVMFKTYGIPYLTNQISERQQIQSTVLRFYEIGESQLVDKIDDLLESQTNPTIAPLASDGEVSLRLTVKGPSDSENDTLLHDLKEKILDRVGEYCYGEGEEELEKIVADILREKKIGVSSAESLTGGAFADTMTKFGGASMIFPGGVVCYSNEAKQEAVGVDKAILEEHGAVSEACAIAMAEGCRKLFRSDYGVSFTGAAGPDPMEGYQPGEMFIGIAGPNETVGHFVKIKGSRSRIRTYAVKQALYLLFQELRNK
ncbi:competence/damage-inducible protein A [Alkalicoccus halolimnae]|uniref:Putative competence-damage inducible protein n=1 Tax=Alkalicoccus halolimnae TaxID=1667239 RepID=A0A5C7FCV8_9BACI|nr:competence/damage-inducible protein A [Alkalicoccus halolimnae]TXF87320.1 competence/damage-inducible protein A [Alkalicoccus halolimnae]